MKKVAILLTSLLLAFVTGCQDHNLEPHPEGVMAWRAGGTEDDLGHSIAVDISGNIYVAGYFTGTATFGNNTLTSNGNRDVYVVKYDNKGDVLWAQKAGGSGLDEGRDIAVDKNGDIYLTGYFQNTITFGSITLTSNNSDDVFLVKYNSSGDVQWAQKAGGNNTDQGFGIAVDMNGFVYVTGYFKDTANFGTISLTSNGDNDIFIAKYASNGDVQWARKAGGTSSDVAHEMTIDESGNVYITGAFYSTPITFGTFTLTPVFSSEEIFVAKYSSTGEVLWVRSAGGSSWDTALGIAVDKSGNVYITGNFHSSMTFGTTTLLSGRFADVFLAKYNNNGEVQWAKQIGGGYENQFEDGGYGVDVDDEGNVYITGFIVDTPVHFSPRTPFSDVAPSITLSANGTDMFIAKYNPAGTIQWARNTGWTGADYGRDIAVDQSGTVYVTGDFWGTATSGTTTLTSSGRSDAFVAKFKQ